MATPREPDRTGSCMELDTSVYKTDDEVPGVQDPHVTAWVHQPGAPARIPPRRAPAGAPVMSGIAAMTAQRGDYSSVSDFAYAILRREIMEGRLVPGQRMREQELSEMLQVSRTPTREALSRLQADGLLVLQPRTGLAVAALDDSAVIEIYETREALEGTAALLAARYANPRDIAALRFLLQAEELDAADPATLPRHNRAFHEALYNAAHNRFLLKSLRALHDAMALLGPTTLSAPGRREQARAEHWRIVDAIERRGGATAEAEMRRHVRNGFPLRQAMRGALARD